MLFSDHSIKILLDLLGFFIHLTVLFLYGVMAALMEYSLYL